VDAKNGAVFERINPMTRAVATVSHAGRSADARAACDAAAGAFDAWAALGPNERRTLLLRCADALAARSDDFARLMLAECGMTAGWAGFNAHLAAGIMREAACLTTQVRGEVVPADKPGTFAIAIRQPAGVVVGIAPWNAPVILGVRAIAAPLACGNTVVLKASESSPGAHALIVEILAEILPPGVVNLVTNAPADAAEVVEALIAHPAVRRVNFTGSTHVGRIVATLCAKYLKPSLLELGGKAPLIVLDDADLDAAVNATVFGAYMNQGQICMATEKVVVDESVADEFVRRLSARASVLPAGDPNGHVVLGSMIGDDAATRVEAQIADALAKGASAPARGGRDGTVLGATVLDGVTPAMRLYSEESFGPVVVVVRVKGVDEAVAAANDTEYGLSASVFGRDVRRAMNVARRIQSGICHVNGPTVADEAQMPFGGVKSSGWGRFGGTAVIAEFTDLRWITVEDPNQHYPF
jgi:acyl-CoA reductase-like NAD-dependent aldehyde dehydrogenase